MTMAIPQLPADKAAHLIAGLVIYCLLAWASPTAGLAACVIAGALKEAWDSTGRGHVEFLDFVATVAGGGIGFYCTLIGVLK